MVREFQKIIGEESKAQLIHLEEKLPNTIIACIGGGSNALGIFHDFVDDIEVNLVGVEAGGKGLSTDEHGSVFFERQLGVFHGMKTYLRQDDDGQIKEAYSISAGLDYPGIGPEHAYFDSIKRVKYVSITDNEAVKAYDYLAGLEGIIPALESSHAIAYAMKFVPTTNKEDVILINLSGRGDKDLDSVTKYKGEHDYE
jgi:tryptophan synthase beta chain